MLFLSGDIGGTKTRLAMFSSENTITPVYEQEFSSQEYSSFFDIFSRFTNELDQIPTDACFGVAGPVSDHSAAITNLPWKIDAKELEIEFDLNSVHLINDLEATAWGISSLNENDLFSLQKGSVVPKANCSIIAAGTGLGQAGMVWKENRYIPFASEGGHCDFAPSNKCECELLLDLQEDNKQVCWEDLLSGPGLLRIYRFILLKDGGTEPEWLAYDDAAARIEQLASVQKDPVSVQTMNIFVRMYGAEAGNHALKLMARGGVYIGGGIAPKILTWLQSSEFLNAFNNKGKMRELMESMPVHVILNDRAAMYGPAIYLQEMVLQN